MTTAEADTVLRRALAAHVAEGIETDPNYSVVVGDGADGDSEGPDAGSPRGLNLLYRSSTLVARSRVPSRIFRALVSYLGGHDAQEHDDGLVRVGFFPLVRGDRAVLAPRWVLYELESVQAHLDRAGLAIADGQWAQIDPDTAELVVSAPRVEVDEDALGALDPHEPRARRGLPPVAPGRYPVAAWGFTERHDRPAPERSAEQVALAATAVTNREVIGAPRALEGLAAVARTARSFSLEHGLSGRDLVTRLDEVASG